MLSATKTTWSWNDAPFSTKLDPRRFFAGESHDESLSRLHFLVDNRRRLGLLTGPSGCGKSMLLQICAKQFRQAGRQVVQASMMASDTEEFLWKVASGLGANPRSDTTPRKLWRDIDDRILANRYQRIDTVLLFDDVEEAENEVLSALVRLSQFDLSDDSRLTIIVACTTGKSHLLGGRLQELCDLRVELEAWTEAESSAFIRSTLCSAACSADLFSDASLAALHRLSEGIPRRLQQLAHLSLIAAAAQDLEQIDEETVEAVQLELTTQPQLGKTWY